ncbi:hypothetical protein ON010_g4853 [Phytophthora cinnamomi]|nr:hypothetical protein ON010_g4853 [Phytophthora cinnamomi]
MQEPSTLRESNRVQHLPYLSTTLGRRTSCLLHRAAAVVTSLTKPDRRLIPTIDHPVLVGAHRTGWADKKVDASAEDHSRDPDRPSDRSTQAFGRANMCCPGEQHELYTDAMVNNFNNDKAYHTISAMCIVAVALSSGANAERQVAETFGLLGLGLGHGVGVGVGGVGVGVGPGVYGPGVVGPGVSVGVPGIASVGVGLPGVGVVAPAVGVTTPPASHPDREKQHGRPPYGGRFSHCGSLVQPDAPCWALTRTRREGVKLDLSLSLNSMWLKQLKSTGAVKNVRANLLFDTGAEVSIIASTFARKVGCEIDSTQTMDCIGVGESIRQRSATSTQFRFTTRVAKEVGGGR